MYLLLLHLLLLLLLLLHLLLLLLHAAPAALARQWAVVGGSTAIRLALVELAASRRVKWHPVCACSYQHLRLSRF
jgi:hypothetical protein